jgi:hypothetical protein
VRSRLLPAAAAAASAYHTACRDKITLQLMRERRESARGTSLGGGAWMRQWGRPSRNARLEGGGGGRERRGQRGGGRGMYMVAMPAAVTMLKMT